MTQPIPLHVLCAYLPYGVKARLLEDAECDDFIVDTETDLTLCGLTTGNSDLLIYDENGNPVQGAMFAFDDGWVCPVDRFKLLLRPLSDLSKPLAELEGKTALESVVDLLNGLGYAWPKAKIQSNENFEEKGIFIAIANDSSLSFRLSPDFYMLPMEAVMKVRELLLSLHFDLFGCLENGWALDLNGETK